MYLDDMLIINNNQIMYQGTGKNIGYQYGDQCYLKCGTNGENIHVLVRYAQTNINYFPSYMLQNQHRYKE